MKLSDGQYWTIIRSKKNSEDITEDYLSERTVEIKTKTEAKFSIAESVSQMSFLNKK